MNNCRELEWDWALSEFLLKVYTPQTQVMPKRMCFLLQVAYQTGNYDLAKKVFSPVWDYFVASPPQGDQSIICLSNIMTITQRR